MLAKYQHFSKCGTLIRLDVRFSNRPVEVKRFQTIRHCSVDVARELVLLFGVGTKALPSWGSKTRRNHLSVGLSVSRTAGPSGLTNSPHPSSLEGHPSNARWISCFLLLGLILAGFHAAAAACCRVHRNSVPSTHMRCMITASHRARATIAFFIPRRLAICMAHALSHDHFLNASCSELLRRASPASSHLRSEIFCRSNRSRLIDIWRRSVQIPPRLPWTCGTERAHRR